MPSDDSPFVSAARIVSNGLTAASRQAANPADILMIEAQPGTTIEDQLHAAVVSGADAAIGPVERDAVEKLAQAESLPLPVVALNAAANADKAPANLVMLSISTEAEAEWIARLAISALPPASFDKPNRIAIITGTSAWEERIRAAYERELQKGLTDYEIVTLDPEKLDELQKQFEPVLTDEQNRELAEAAREAMQKATTDAQKKRAERDANNARRTMIATAEPPYQAALLALSAEEAGLVRNRLPIRMRVWATSATNPGDPATSSTAKTLAYDLNNLVFSESPIVVRYDPTSFEARFSTAMPYSPAAKRLFALGVDAYAIAEQWSQRRSFIEHNGETGELRLTRSTGAEISRTPLTVTIQGGNLLEIAPATAAQPELPTVTAPPDPSTLTFAPVNEMSHDVRRESVRGVVIEDQGAGPAPTPMLPKKAAVPARPAAHAPAAPGVPLVDPSTELHAADPLPTAH